MLHVDQVGKPTTGRLANRALRQKPSPEISKDSNKNSVSISFSSVELDGTGLCESSQDASIALLAEAIRLASLYGKDELMIRNISPGIGSGDTKAASVPLIKKRVEGQLKVACRNSLMPTPECRLDLTNGQFGLRCYLGRNKPTDFIFASDQLSDSR